MARWDAAHPALWSFHICGRRVEERLWRGRLARWSSISTEIESASESERNQLLSVMLAFARILNLPHDSEPADGTSAPHARRFAALAPPALPASNRSRINRPLQALLDTSDANVETASIGQLNKAGELLQPAF